MLRVKLPSVVKSAFVAAVVSAALSSDASARQQRPRAQESRSPAASRDTRPQRAAGEDAADANADLSIMARVTASEVRFEKVPNTRVDFTGKPERVTVWEAERENLPPQVQPGVTYRNVGITLRITSVFADIDRIVAEALGEVPVNDEEARPAPAQPSTTPPAQPSDAPPPNTPTTAPPASPSPSRTSPANSVTNAPRLRPAQRGRGK